MLEVDGISCGYGDVAVTNNVSIVVPERSVIALLGANGAGKSTTLLAIAGLLRKQRGSIRFRGAAIENLSAPAILRRGLALVPERRELFPDMSVAENLQLGGFIHDRKTNEKSLHHVVEMFPRLNERFRQRVGTLSGGEQQMLAIARGLMSKPSLIMLDEPSLGIAPMIVEEIFRAIETMVAEGMSILLVEQNAVRALEISSHAYLMEGGEITQHGDSAAFLNDKSIKDKYLG
jgi:branched-chain amino acid transport system ATP-binding protein